MDYKLDFSITFIFFHLQGVFVAIIQSVRVCCYVKSACVFVYECGMWNEQPAVASFECCVLDHVPIQFTVNREVKSMHGNKRSYDGVARPWFSDRFFFSISVVIHNLTLFPTSQGPTMWCIHTHTDCLISVESIDRAIDKLSMSITRNPTPPIIRRSHTLVCSTLRGTRALWPCASIYNMDNSTTRSKLKG